MTGWVFYVGILWLDQHRVRQALKRLRKDNFFYYKDIHPMSNVRNVFEAILKYGHDEDFSPNKEGFEATNAPAGSEDKIKILRRRVEQGTPLWHRNDRHDYSGLTGAVRPRE